MTTYTPPRVEVLSDQTHVDQATIRSIYKYSMTEVTPDPRSGTLYATPSEAQLVFLTQRRLPKLGVMLVGWGGNNGSTLTASIMANKLNLTWETRRGIQRSNYFGSITQSSSVRIGLTAELEEVFVPMNALLPMVNPNDLVLGGWDCNGANMADAMQRAAVLDIDLQHQLKERLRGIQPLPAIFFKGFVAENQEARADHVIAGTIDGQNKQRAVEQVRQDIRNFKATHHLDKVIVLWTANTERFCVVEDGVHDTADNLLAALARNHGEISPSACYAIAAIQEGCSYINGAPQNTFVPGLIELARMHGVFLGGDDFKSGQTKMKCALIEFFVGAGIKPEAIVSYNHLGNNDGRNLHEPRQFRSKEISKSSVIDDMVASNPVLYPPGTPGPDHVVVIKYVPYVGDSKRAMDEYIFSIFMGGQQTLAMHNTCEDSLLAAPLVLDLVILTELMERVTVSADGGHTFERVNPVLSMLSYLLKAPKVPEGTPVINGLNRQKQCIENILRALIGLPPEHSMMLEGKVDGLRKTWCSEPYTAQKARACTSNGNKQSATHTVSPPAIC